MFKTKWVGEEIGDYFNGQLSNPTGFYLTPGQVSDLENADALPREALADLVITDKAYQELHCQAQAVLGYCRKLR
ncbi:hypothetical protein [Pseudogulbenkiania sp. MAI-1]|uniref:hypothetical protein n=1 Tax=Pseudogulbenkiania sp. MAI-1 TaxID=990370 RepID=UPI0012EB20BA|nr:hypothetical protein [Pseudogulbenkiania sp. MAI-1]